jgi:hypothetical protein
MPAVGNTDQGDAGRLSLIAQEHVVAAVHVQIDRQ